MKKNVLFALTFIGLSCSYGQELNVKKVKEKVVVAKNIKKVYYVLKYNTDKRHGSYEEFLGKKKVVSGSYDLGLKDGDWLYTDGTGKYLQKGRFNKGLEVGEWEYRNFKGFYKRAFFSNKGRLDSAYSYDVNKELVYKYVFDQEKNEGISETYLTDGFKEVTITKDSLKSVSIYYPNNQLFFEKKKAGSKLISTSNYYKKNGDLFRSSNFVDGTGMVLNFHLDKLVSTGQLVGSSSVTYKNGEPLGVYVSYDKKGTFLERGVLVKSIRVGKWMLWSSQKNQYVEKDYGPYNPKKKKTSKRMSLNNVSDVSFKAIQNPPLLMSNNDYSDNLQDAKKSLVKWLTRT
ncbi:hypothetical protein [Wenyingzhuangia sp. 2_MG-2023]|uniref:hypothetical protein n=1 Tax=Wenyingzhuangia sp. 2_MG-2023 TaxID=3062639 RepID=UPI0026E3A3A3|nr:hypothetical protein [Wenyingzhuangia sp. 2_MG-2023]MDO6738344.1 hypothetical protein [Wenyingzhuangia sp. 2_MG-2023]